MGQSGIVLRCCILIGKTLVKIPLSTSSDLRNQPRCKLSGNLWDITRTNNAVINIELVRLLPRQWPKVGRGAAKLQLKRKKTKYQILLNVLLPAQHTTYHANTMVPRSCKKSRNIAKNYSYYCKRKSIYGIEWYSGLRHCNLIKIRDRTQ